MAEEQANQVEAQHDGQQEQGPAEAQVNFRDNPVFRNLTAELSEAREMLAKIKSDQEAKDSLAKKKLLEDQGNYEEALRQTEAQWAEKLKARDDELSSMQKQIRDSKIKNLMVSAGVVNDLAVMGAVQVYEQSGAETVEGWFEEFSKSETFSGLVPSEQSSPGHPRPAPAVIGSASGKSIADRMTSSDPGTRRAAQQEASRLDAAKREQVNAEANRLAAQKAKAKYKR